MPALRLTVLTVIAIVAPIVASPAQQRRADPPRIPSPPPPRPTIMSGTVTTVTVQQRMIIRVPRLPVGRTALTGAGTAAVLPPIRWVETKSDKCIPVISLAAAAVTGSDSVDLLLNGGKRLRARFGSECPALDFYSGFYVKMPKDGKVCSGRDSFRARSGGECRIKSFRALVPGK